MRRQTKGEKEGKGGKAHLNLSNQNENVHQRVIYWTLGVGLHVYAHVFPVSVTDATKTYFNSSSAIQVYM